MPIPQFFLVSPALSFIPIVSSLIQPLIHAIEQADSPDRLIGAVQALVAAQSEASIPTLISVLGYNNPGAAVVAMKGLVQMGEAAVLPLMELLDDYNYGARAYAIRALAAIADPRALDILLSTAETDFAPSVRRAATKGVGGLRWFQLLPDQVAAAQTRAFETLNQVSQDPDWSLRYAAVVGLQTLATSLEPGQSVPLSAQILARLKQMADDSDFAVQSRAWMALHILEQSLARDVQTAAPTSR
ncbi:MAG: HEAT repeat domain-containing protein [Leptolyngbyaceae cyanobacterium SL_5_9]|nr:HEAT repeat domain-containing protein [Leptolyngbyaceae cyanobacterium SL_5_9]